MSWLSGIDKFITSLNPLQHFTQFANRETVGKIPGIGQLAGYGLSHPVEAYAAASAVYAGASALGAGGAGAGAAGSGAGAASSLPADLSVGTTGAGGATAAGSGAASSTFWGAAARGAGQALAGSVLSRAMSPGMPAVPPPAPPLQAPQGLGAAAGAIARARGAVGVGSTNVTGPQGLIDPATTAPKTLLGG